MSGDIVDLIDEALDDATRRWAPPWDEPEVEEPATVRDILLYEGWDGYAVAAWEKFIIRLVLRASRDARLAQWFAERVILLRGDPTLSTLAREARALGYRLSFEIEPMLDEPSRAWGTREPLSAEATAHGG